MRLQSTAHSLGPPSAGDQTHLLQEGMVQQRSFLPSSDGNCAADAAEYLGSGRIQAPVDSKTRDRNKFFWWAQRSAVPKWAALTPA